MAVPAVEVGGPGPADPQDGLRLEEIGPARQRVRGTFLAFVVPTLATLAALCFRNRYLFSLNIREDGDFAANSILIQKATHLRLFVGNYSRVGFNHPGPAFMYVQAVGQTLWWRVLHIGASPYDGQLLAVLMLNSVLVGLVVMIFYRRTRSGAAAAAVFGVIGVFAGYHLSLASPWFPHLYFAPFLLFMVAGASVASGDLADLPSLVLAGGLLVHGHVSFIEFVGGWTVVVAVAWARRHRVALRARLAEQRKTVVVAGVLLGLFLLPMVINVVFHFPGEWGHYYRYVQRNGTNTHPLRQAIKFLLSFWAHRRRSGALLAMAGLIGLVATVVQRDPDRRRFFAWLFGAGFFMSLLFLAYAVRGVDDLNQGYIGIFYMSVPLLMLMTAASAVTTRLTSGFARAGDRHRAGSVSRGFGLRSAVPLVAAAVLLAFGLRGPGLTNPYRGQPDVSAAIASVSADAQRGGRPVAIDFPHSMWPQVFGFLVNAHRAGLSTCISDPFWTFMVTTDNVCRPAALQTDWRVSFDPSAPSGGAPAPGRSLVWSDGLTTITAGL